MSRPTPWWVTKKERRALASHTHPPKVYFGGKECARKPTWMLYILVWFHEEMARLEAGDPTCDGRHAVVAAACREAVIQRYIHKRER